MLPLLFLRIIATENVLVAELDKSLAYISIWNVFKICLFHIIFSTKMLFVRPDITFHGRVTCLEFYDHASILLS